MKKLLATVILTALTLSPLTAFATPFVDEFAGNQTDQKNAEFNAIQSQIAGLTQQGQVAGCSANGNFGGALSSAIGGAVGGKIQQVFGQLGAKAGPFAPVVNALGNIVSNKVQGLLSSGAQQLADSLFGGGGSVAGAAGGALGGGAAGLIAGGGAGVPGANAVPVNEQGTVKTDTTTIKDQTKTIQDKTVDLHYKECVSDPLVAKIRNAIIAMITKSTISWLNNGFEGGPAFVQNLKSMAYDITSTAIQEAVQKTFAGICSSQRQDIQTIVLTQYQYESDLGKQVQCTTKDAQVEARAKGDFSGGGGLDGIYASLFSNDGIYAYPAAKSVADIKAASALADKYKDLSYGQGFQSQVKCTDGQTMKPGTACINGTITVPAALIKDVASQQYLQPNQQLISADEIGELIDALMASLTQVAFQGIDGVLGVSEKNKNGNGSYLDNLVGQTSDNSIGDAQSTLLNDAEGVQAIEQQFQDILNEIMDNLTNTKQKYQDVAACYVKLNTTLSSKISSETSTARANLASSTIAQYITPQITEIQRQIDASQDALDQMDIIIANIQSAQSIDDITAASTAYNNLVASGAVHTATDLGYLQNDLAAGAIALQVLNTDASDKLNECRSY
jgi:hypothetical protein